MKKSKHVLRKLEKRQQNRTLDSHIEEQFGGGRLLACISSRPGQCGRADGYVTFNSFCHSLSNYFPQPFGFSKLRLFYSFVNSLPSSGWVWAEKKKKKLWLGGIESHAREREKKNDFITLT